MEKQNKKITKDMNFIEVLETKPEAGEILFRNGMHCVGCAMSMYETLEQGAMAHGLDPDKIVDELNGEKNKPVKKKTLVKKKKTGVKKTSKKKR